MAGQADQPLQHLMRGVGFHGIIYARQRQCIAKSAKVSFHSIHVHHQTRRRRLMLHEELGDFGSHRTRPSSDGRSSFKAMSVVDETVERTSDQTIARTLDVVA
jgi:hypothetical protein